MRTNPALDKRKPFGIVGLHPPRVSPAARVQGMNQPFLLPLPPQPLGPRWQHWCSGCAVQHGEESRLWWFIRVIEQVERLTRFDLRDGGSMVEQGHVFEVSLGQLDRAMEVSTFGTAEELPCDFKGVVLQQHRPNTPYGGAIPDQAQVDDVIVASASSKVCTAPTTKSPSASPVRIKATRAAEVLSR